MDGKTWEVGAVRLKTPNKIGPKRRIPASTLHHICGPDTAAVQVEYG
jgi:hypothetical protein